MTIDPTALQFWINHFYGYGSWNARTWFVSYEEAGGDLPEDVAERTSYFYDRFASEKPITGLCDVRGLFKHVDARLAGSRAKQFANLYEYRFGSNAFQHHGWKNLISFAHGFNGEKQPDLLAYQKKSFLSPEPPTETLIPLYPLPSPHNHAWYYSWIDLPRLGFIRNRAQYQSHVYDERIHHILENIVTFKPHVVVMYGMSNINALKKSIRRVFPGAGFTMVKGTKLEIPQHHHANVGNTTLVITTQMPTLKHNRTETGFDWRAFGELVR